MLLSGAGACVADPGPQAISASDSEAIKVCAAGEVVEGIDVSTYQGTIDWAQVKAAGVDFAYIRVSDGLPPIDSKFTQNWANAHAAGVLRGAYQFFREDEDPVAQADLVLDTMGPLDDDDLPVAIDVETTDKQTGTTMVAHIQAWMDRIEAGSGKKPIIYTGRPFWDESTDSSTAVSDHTLWIPNWGVTCPSISAAWSGWGFWQYSATGSVAGIAGDVDRDRWNGDRAALLAFAGVASRPDAPPVAPDAPPAPDAAQPPPDAGVMIDPPGAPAPPAELDGGAVAGGCSLSAPASRPGEFLAALALVLVVCFPLRRTRAKIPSA